MEAFVTFTVPVTSGQYASEVLYLGTEQALSDLAFDQRVDEASLVLGSLVSGVTIELDVLRPGGDPNTAGHWMLAVQTWNTAGLQSMLQLAGWRGARLRAKSGGTSGSQDVAASWR